MTAPAFRSTHSPLALVPDIGPAVKIRQHARPNRWTAQIRLPEGNYVALHRADDPLGEARAQLRTSSARDPRVIAIVGAGLGYLTQAAHECFPSARIVVFEPIPLLAQGALSRTPALYASGQVRIVIGPRFDNAGDLWRLFDVESPDEPDPPLLLNPELQRAAPAAIATAVLLVRRATGGARMNARARREHAGRYVVNTLRNLPHIIKGVDPQRLIGQFGGVPAVLVAAGPSLDQNLPALRQFADRALIVATDTAWRPLVSAGIDPHLVISLDPSTLNGRHLTGVTSRRDTWLLAEASVDPAALRPFAGRVGTFRVGMHHPWPWLAELGVNRPLAQVWGSVLTAVFDLSLAFGCDPLVFVGADLSFTDQRPYCRGTTFEHAWARHAAEGASLRLIWHNTITARASLVENDIHGQPVLTAANLAEFRNWLVTHAARQTGRHVINATGAGILFGQGITQADLATALASFPDRGDTVRDTIRRLLSLRTVSVHLRPVMDALAAIERAAADGTADADTSSSPVPEWLAFGRPSLTTASIHAAASEGLADLERQWPHAGSQTGSQRPSPEAPAPRLHEADRVALMRALLTNDRTTLDGCATVEASPSLQRRQACVSEIAGVLSTLLEMPKLIDSAGQALVLAASGGVVPLSYRFAWNAAAAPWIAALEELLLEAWAGLAPDRARNGTGRDFWSGWVVPVADTPDESATEPAADDEQRARFELTSLRIALFAESSEGGSQQQARLARALDTAATGTP